MVALSAAVGYHARVSPDRLALIYGRDSGIVRDLKTRNYKLQTSFLGVQFILPPPLRWGGRDWHSAAVSGFWLLVSSQNERAASLRPFFISTSRQLKPSCLGILPETSN